MADTNCGHCNGDGWTVEPECCGKGTIHGCCGEPNPIQVQCEHCNGEGVIYDAADPASHLYENEVMK